MISPTLDFSRAISSSRSSRSRSFRAVDRQAKRVARACARRRGYDRSAGPNGRSRFGRIFARRSGAMTALDPEIIESYDRHLALNGKALCNVSLPSRWAIRIASLSQPIASAASAVVHSSGPWA